MKTFVLLLFTSCYFSTYSLNAQADTTKPNSNPQTDTVKPITIKHSYYLKDTSRPIKDFKNVIRYNLSGPLIFGFDYLVLGYERVLGKNRSFSINVGQATFPKLISIFTDSFSINRDRKNSGYNVSVSITGFI